MVNGFGIDGGRVLSSGGQLNIARTIESSRAFFLASTVEMQRMVPVPTDQLKMDLRTGSIRYRRQNGPFEPILRTKDKNRITLPDIVGELATERTWEPARFIFVEAALNVMSEMFYMPIEFEEYVR